ncbi:putative uncharacterized ACR [Bacteroidales bacterium Barb4]|nr:putative uncharacterized ACR [Bacteroidales bacterium Barb4]
MDRRIKLHVKTPGNHRKPIAGTYVLRLAEERGVRSLSVIIGTAEAQSIAVVLEGVVPPRPLTHDLFASLLQTVNLDLKEVFIYKHEDGVFFSELLLADGNREIRLDSRTSDAVAIALRMKCDIYTTEDIMQRHGTTSDKSDAEPLLRSPVDRFSVSRPEPIRNQEPPGRGRDLFQLKSNDLKKRMEEAVSQENYEQAKIYNDELHRRQEEGKLP